MSNRCFTRREFLGTAAALSAPVIVPGSIFRPDKIDDVRLSPDSLRKVDAASVNYFGCSLEELKGDETHVLTHYVYACYRSALVFRHAKSCIVSVPHCVPDVERSQFRAVRPAEAFDPRFLAKTFLVSAARVHGPNWIGIVDRTAHTPVQSVARVLGDADEPALRKLAVGCGGLENGSIRNRLPKRLFGMFRGEDLVSVSGSFALGDIANVFVMVHPDYRGKVYGKHVLSAAVADAITTGYVVTWSTRESNLGAVTFAKSLGFHAYASIVKVEIEEDTF